MEEVTSCMDECTTCFSPVTIVISSLFLITNRGFSHEVRRGKLENLSTRIIINNVNIRSIENWDLKDCRQKRYIFVCLYYVCIRIPYNYKITTCSLVVFKSKNSDVYK